MNEIKRYDQALAEKLEHLPMPPEDIAWAEMKKMLEETDDDPVVIPFFRRPGCLLPALVAVLLLFIGGWFFFKKNAASVSATQQKELIIKEEDKFLIKTDSNSFENNIPESGSENLKETKDSLSQKANSSGQSNTLISTDSGNKNTEDNIVNPGKKRIIIPAKSAIKISYSGTAENVTTKAGAKKKKKPRTVAGKTKVNIVPTFATADSATEDSQFPADEVIKNNTSKPITTVSPADSSTPKTTITDSSSIVKKDSLPPKKTKAQPTPEKESTKNSWMLAAGLSVFQPLAIDGESAVPYNRYGRKGSLTDYIPAIHFRLYRNKKWFVHTGFRYGAPQSIKPFDYNKSEKIDSNLGPIRSVYQLKKTYYHQLPFSFNYYVLPNLSVGAGIIYNHFSGAIAREDVYRGNTTIDTLLSSATIKDKDAGKFIKNHLQLSAEMQYQWKRLSLGFRYSSDINPYIQYNDINTGAAVEKKAKALNIFLRYDLWRSKKL